MLNQSDYEASIYVGLYDEWALFDILRDSAEYLGSDVEDYPDYDERDGYRGDVDILDI